MIKMNEEEPVPFVNEELVICYNCANRLKQLKNTPTESTIWITDFATMNMKRKIVLSQKEHNI